jgi:hypothetical protein
MVRKKYWNKKYLRNFDIFARMNVGGTFFVGVDLVLKLKNSFI